MRERERETVTSRRFVSRLRAKVNQSVRRKKKKLPSPWWILLFVIVVAGVSEGQALFKLIFQRGRAEEERRRK